MDHCIREMRLRRRLTRAKFAGMMGISVSTLKRIEGGMHAYSNKMKLAAGCMSCGWMLVRRDDDDERAGRIAGISGLAMVALGLSISTDELAIGFSLGLVRLPVVPVIIAIAVVALLASQLGLALGRIVSERFRERAEKLAAVALILLGAYLIAERTLSG